MELLHHLEEAGLSHKFYQGDSRLLHQVVQPSTVDLIITDIPDWRKIPYTGTEIEIGQEDRIQSYIFNLAMILESAWCSAKPGAYLFLKYRDQMNSESPQYTDFKDTKADSRPKERRPLIEYFEEQECVPFWPFIYNVARGPSWQRKPSAWLFKGHLYWDRTTPPLPTTSYNGRPMQQLEPIAVFQKSREERRLRATAEQWHEPLAGIIRAKGVKRLRARIGEDPHPCPWSQIVLETIFRTAHIPGGLVFDPFAGSCGVATQAHAYGMNSISIDLSQDYLGWGYQYLSEVTAQLRLPIA